ncbi:MAG: peptidoglycan DD-metalloendopeptidase family protein [Actinomycetota bacterium]|nr:peptidoglycan DD-metalloendopeptidase family protein [Actinomycetota bacterium]
MFGFFLGPRTSDANLTLMWPRMLSRAILVALLVALPLGGTLTAGATRGPVARGHANVPHAIHGSWSWPVVGPHPIARPYLAPPTPYAAGHRGIDIRAEAGTSVIAPDDGVVHFVGVVVDRPVVSIAHDRGVLSSFEPVSSALSAGDPVTRGEVIGTLLPGHCTSPCLHLGARIDGAYVNPLLFLGGVPWSVLLPSG